MHRLLEKYDFLKLTPFHNELAELINTKKNHVARYVEKDENLSKVKNGLPDVTPSIIDLDSDWICIGKKSDLNPSQHAEFYKSLRLLCPWRKGPFDIFGIKVDAEWVSYLKWNRIKDHIKPLAGRRILDIGSSCGYYLFKMASYRPKMVVGIEPYIRFYCQYLALNHLIQLPNTYCIPAKLEEVPVFKSYFDTVFCMGILYHRRSPIDTLKVIHENMKKGGELVLETMVIKGDSDIALFPRDRYAKMRNIFFIPTVRCLTSWLKRAGFENIRWIDTTPTTLNEQRKTDWVNTESLEDFLDPDDPAKTIEGYPAPLRSILIAEAK
jgi:tRNA (mo5U34)-methyltransferase